MKKLIEFLTRKYNKRARPQDRIMVTKPVVYDVKRISTMNIEGLKKKEPEFYAKMVGEKLYDLRHELIDRLWKDGAIEHSVKEKGKELTITLTLNIHGKDNSNASKGGEDSDDGVRIES